MTAARKKAAEQLNIAVVNYTVDRIGLVGSGSRVGCDSNDLPLA